MIIEYDFGKKERVAPSRAAPPPAQGRQPAPETERSRAAAAEMPLERARARAFRLEAALRAAKAACESRRTGRTSKILVDADEYARLLRCKELVVSALKV